MRTWDGLDALVVGLPVLRGMGVRVGAIVRGTVGRTGVTGTGTTPGVGKRVKTRGLDGVEVGAWDSVGDGVIKPSVGEAEHPCTQNKIAHASAKNSPEQNRCRESLEVLVSLGIDVW